MAACSIFEEDEVCIPTSTGGFKYGLVVESSEYISSDEDDDEFENRVQKGTVKIAWHPSGDETVVAENKLILTDRSLMPGDVVRRLNSERDSQCGFVENILVKCHLKILGTEQWIYNVDVADVASMQEWDTESEVTLDSWVGQLYEIREDVTVRFPDGARCILKDAGMSNLEDINDKRCDNSEFEMRAFYPDQELCGEKDDFEGAKWLHTTQMRGPDSLGAKALYTVPVIVEKVEVSGVDVRWLCKGFTRAGSEKDALESPPRHVEGEMLKRFLNSLWSQCFEICVHLQISRLLLKPVFSNFAYTFSMKIMDGFQHCHNQIGDKGYYVVKETDTVLKNMSPRQHYTPDIVQKMSKDNITVIGTSKGGLVLAVKDKINDGGNKENEAPVQNGIDNDLEIGATDKENKVPVENGLDNTEENASYIVDNDEENYGDDEFEDVDVDGGGGDSDNSSNNAGGVSSPAGRRKMRKRSNLKCLKTLKRSRGKQARKKLKPPERVVKAGDKVPVEIWYTFSSCGVVWQDGNVEENIPSPELFPIHHLDEFEYFPGDFVVDAKGNANTDYGVIVSCDHKERTCMVKWMKPYFPGKSHSPEEGETVEVSVYDIKDHPDYKFRPGNTVIRVGGFEGSNEDLEAVGQVNKLDSDGSIHIWWPSNTITKCFPQDLFLISDDMSGVDSSEDWSGSEEEEGDEEEEDTDVSWETEGEESADTEEEPEEESKKNSPNKPLWVCDDAKKKDLDELLQRVQAAVTGLLDVFLNVPGPFFKNSKLVFQDILAIFKRCKEMERIMKSSYFNEPEISDLISEIKDELRKENTSKLARHVASLYKYRTLALPDLEDIDKGTGEKAKAMNEKDEHEGPVKGDNLDGSGAMTEGNSCKADSGSLDLTDNGDSGAVASGGIDDSPLKVEEEATRQKLKKAILDYRTHIEDPLLQIIFDTSLHLGVVRTAQKKLENKNDTQEKRDCVNSVDLQSEGILTEKMKDLSNRPVNDQSVEEVIESAIISVCSGDQDSAEVAALKVSAKRKVEEMCCTAIADSVETESTEPGLQNSDDIQSTCSVLPKFQCSSEAQSSQVHSQEDSMLKLHEVKPDLENKSGDSTEKSELPTSHRNLCVRICKALNSRLYHIQQEVNRKWLAFKVGCDVNASDREIFEKLQAKMIESHEKYGVPLSLFGPSETKSEDKKGNEKKEELNKSETQSISDLPNNSEGDTLHAAHANESTCRTSECEIASVSKDSEFINCDTEGATTSAMENGEANESHSGFELCSEVCSSHWFRFQEQKSANQKAFNTAVRKELMLLQTSLPEGIFVKAYEDRMDLFSVMIVGPAKTPYEDGLFAFDVQLPANFPSSPPVFHYLSFCNERLNPNLYEDGKVCVSLLGTWSGKGSEMWTNKSNLLQVLISIQGLILVDEPYYNEAGYEKQRGTQHAQENSRMYNEMAILKLVQSMTKLALTPPTAFVTEARDHLNKNAARMIKRLESWIDLSSSQKTLSSSAENQSENGNDNGISQRSHDQSDSGNNGEKENTSEVSGHALPDFPLLPASKGFCLTLKKHLDNFKTVLNEHIWIKDSPDH